MALVQWWCQGFDFSCPQPVVSATNISEDGGSVRHKDGMVIVFIDFKTDIWWNGDITQIFLSRVPHLPCKCKAENKDGHRQDGLKSAVSRARTGHFRRRHAGRRHLVRVRCFVLG
jgi:hypothetical protein